MNWYIPPLKFLIPYIRNFFSEALGTGVMVFLGCMACKSSPEALEGSEPNMGVLLSFGLSAFIAVQICHHNSGGYINPVVTLVALFFHRLDYCMAASYILGELVGAVLGFGLLQGLTPDSGRAFCVNKPGDAMTDFQATVLEASLTAVLILIVCSVFDPRNAGLTETVSLKVGFALFALAFSADKFSGSSMNPARSFGPALWQNQWDRQWIYWVGPISGGIIAAIVYTHCFSASETAEISTADVNRNNGQ